MIGARATLDLRRRVAHALERGALANPVTRAIATFTSTVLSRPRPLRAPPHVRIVCVGGATLGGSGKSRLANAIAHASGAILVGHGYRAGDRRARFVSPEESVASAGDEALAAARAGLRVVIGPTREAAIALAARHGDLLVLDGPLAVTHARSVSVLAVDEDAPWGSGEVFPAGDLRAERATLSRLADFVVPVPSAVEPPPELERPFGLFTALARPERLIRQLGPDVVVSAPDHGPLDRRRREAMQEATVETWVATEKCATHLDDVSRTPGTARFTSQSPPVRIFKGRKTKAFSLVVLRDTYMACLDRAFVRRIVSSTDCERAGREDTRYDHRPKTGG